MIRVHRPTATPAVLAVVGRVKALEHCAAYVSGLREFEFDADIYGHSDVKSALVSMHNSKCCYCESKVRHVSPGTIDHFRPKAASQQSEGTPFFRPGYYWLAYDWDNLLFSCPACNQMCKRNQFPLRNPSQRARTHLDSVDQEEALLIDPSKEDPVGFVSYREEFVFAVNDNVRGRATIDILKLNDRPDLVECRRDKIKVLGLMGKIVKLLPRTDDAAAAAQEYLNNAVSERGEYVAMCRAFLT